MKIHANDTIAQGQFYKVTVDGKKVDVFYADDENGFVLYYDTEMYEVVRDSLIQKGNDRVYEQDDPHGLLEHLPVKMICGEVIITTISEGEYYADRL